MREIKFRAWDKKNKIMVILDKMWWDTEYSSLAFGSEEEEYDGIDRLPWTYEESEENVIVMQYTGLKDKNGKEIYEGDICKIELMPVERFHLEYGFAICVVEWSNEFTGYNFKSKINQTTNSGEGWAMNNANMFKIIGNIYENPELLST